MVVNTGGIRLSKGNTNTEWEYTLTVAGDSATGYQGVEGKVDELKGKYLKFVQGVDDKVKDLTVESKEVNRSNGVTVWEITLRPIR